MAAGAGGHELADLLVGRLTEVVVGEAHREKRLRRLEADDLVGLAAELRIRRERRDGYGDHRRRGSGGRDGAERGPHRGSGGEAVVDQDRRPPGGVDDRPAAAILGSEAIDLGRGAIEEALQLRRAQSGADDHRLVDYSGAIVGDGAHRQLRLPWKADLPDDHDLERQQEPARDRGGHGNASARESEHERIAAAVPGQARGEPATRVGAIAKER
jgi:hypothetical protein